MALMGIPETFEERKAWLTKPADWAFSASFYGAFGCPVMYFAGIEPEWVLVNAIGASMLAAAFSLLQVRRHGVASRGGR